MVSVSSTRVLGPRFELLDYLRFLAAFAVLAYHWLYRGIETGMMSTVSYSAASPFVAYGYLGVDLFFMISGFVIAISAHGRAASDFAVRRGVRLYPAFWAAMLLTAAVTALWGAPEMRVTLIQVIANLTMAPNVFDQPLVDGVYWTLLNELIFYGMVFLFLLLRIGKWLDAFFPAWALLMVGVLHLAPGLSSRPLLGGLFSFFAAGAIISTIHRRGWDWWQAIGLLASFYVAIRYVITDVDRINDMGGPFEQSTLITCIVVASFFVVMLAQILPPVRDWRLPQSRLLGALTYPLYLLHAHLAFIFFNHFANEDIKWLMYSLALVLVLALAYALYQFVEVKPKRFWVRAFELVIGTPIRALEQLGDRVSRRRALRAAQDSSASSTALPHTQQR